MKTLKILPALLVFAACATAPSLTSYFVTTGVMQYFLPPTEWAAQGSRSKACLDITYRTGTDTPATVNISFFGEKSIPRSIISVSLNGSGVDYPLDNITVLYPNPDERELRITAEGSRDTLASLLESETITLTAEIDGVIHTYISRKDFIKLKDDLLTVISYQ
jgi:hypothetical protein